MIIIDRWEVVWATRITRVLSAEQTQRRPTLARTTFCRHNNNETTRTTVTGQIWPTVALTTKQINNNHNKWFQDFPWLKPLSSSQKFLPNVADTRYHPQNKYSKMFYHLACSFQLNRCCMFIISTFVK